jgi:hypothetical protein
MNLRFESAGLSGCEETIPMRKPSRSLLISAVAALAVSLTATAAVAATGSGHAGHSAASRAPSWSLNEMNVQLGLSSLGPAVVTDATTGGAITCSGATGYLNIKGGMGLRSGLATGQPQFDSCTLPDGTTVTLTAGTALMTMTGLSYDPSTHLGVTTGRWKGLQFFISGSTCSGVLDGTAAGADDGYLTYQFYNNPSWLILRKFDGNLHVYNVSGCAGVFSSGDAVTVSATFPFSNMLITSP